MKFKLYMVPLFVLLVLQGFSQTDNITNKGFQITGNVPSFKDSVVLAWFSGYKFDTKWTRAVNGKFVFTGEMPRPTCAVIGDKDGSFSRLIYFHEGEITISQKAAGEEATVIGSPINDDYEALVKLLKRTDSRHRTLSLEMEQLKLTDPAAAEKKNREEISLIERKNADIIKNYIATHPDKIFSLMQLIVMPLELEELKSLFYGLDPALKNTPEGSYVIKKIANTTTEYVGKPVIDFIQKSDKGMDVNSTSYRGRYLLIDFWASWCVPCRRENPHMLKAYERFKDKGFDIIGISLDDNEKKWKDAITEDNMPWVQVSDLKGMSNTVGNLYNIVLIPSNFLVDPNGIIIAKDLRGNALEKKLADLFSKVK